MSIHKFTVEPVDNGCNVRVGVKTLFMPGTTQEQFALGLKKYTVEGAYIQDAFDFLNDDQREFLMTGITPAEFNFLFGNDEGDF